MSPRQSSPRLMSSSPRSDVSSAWYKCNTCQILVESKSRFLKHLEDKHEDGPKTTRRSSTSRAIKKSSDYKDKYEKIYLRALEVVVINQYDNFKRVSKPSTPIRPQPGPSSPKKSSLTTNQSGKNNQKQSMVTTTKVLSQSPEADRFISMLNVRDDDLVLHPGYFPFVCRFCDSKNCKSLVM